MIATVSTSIHRSGTLEAYQVSMERVIGYMKANLAEPLDLERLGLVAGISKFHFVKVFEESTGTTPHHFLACLRIQRAKERLLYSQSSITEICMGVGYSSLGSFSQTFREMVGVSPKELRAMPARLTLRDFAGAARRWIAGYRTTAGPQLEGEIESPSKVLGFIFVGAFGGGVPQGVPVSGTVLLRPGPFRIARPVTPEFHLLAALIPFSASLTAMVANLPLGLVASQRLHNSKSGELAKVRLCLRPMRITDPPVVIALPALLP